MFYAQLCCEKGKKINLVLPEKYNFYFWIRAKAFFSNLLLWNRAARAHCIQRNTIYFSEGRVATYSYNFIGTYKVYIIIIIIFYRNKGVQI